jgi:sortase A
VDVRRAIRGVGKTLISVGILLFLFVAYQLWGTGIAERRGQNALEAKFERSLLSAPPTLPAPEGMAPPTTAPPPPELGDAVAMIEIPKIDVKKLVVEGVEVEDLKIAPGHYPETVLPGEAGNAAIAGHRTTYGAPFYDLDELAAGDPIFVTTPAGRFRYDVVESTSVLPSEISVLLPTEDDRLTLTTCDPPFSAARRLIVVARLVSEPVEAAPRPPPEDRPQQQLPAESTREISAGLSGESSDKTPAIVWGAVAAAVWLGGWLLGRAWRRWPAYVLTAPVFLVVLFVFYENVARLLPANV